MPRLSIAAKRMASQNVLVKDLQGVETLGMCHLCLHWAQQPLMTRYRLGEFSCYLIFDLAHRMCQLTLLATDKTGTLTRNQMTVRTRRLNVDIN